jgi:glycerol-3-phosphate dehydrogenase (NAD(P)+)
LENRETIAVVGAGSWGTALAIQFARSGHRTLLWGRQEDHLDRLRDDRENQQYLPGAMFPDSLEIQPDLESALREAPNILVSVPSHSLRIVLEKIKPLMKEVLGENIPMAVLSGPTFAREVGDGLPSAMTVAATDEAYARTVAENVSSETFRAYTSTDIVGVEVGGAGKNELAIGAGICDGLGFGANTRIALITRGLVEMERLGIALGAQPATFMGLAGMGDLVLTCTDNLSRNRRMGLALAAGKTVAEAEKEIRQVVEGVKAAQAVHKVAERAGVEMPICEQIYRILYEDARPEEAVETLMQRALKSEFSLR